MSAPLRRVMVACLAGALAGCAGSGGTGAGAADRAGGDSGALQGSTTELRTMSDQTNAEKRAVIRMQLAVGYYQQGNYAIALDEIKQAIAANPELAEAYGVRAVIYIAMNEMALADDNYQRALRLAPRNPELNNNYGSFLCQVGRYQLGMEQFELALKNPNYASPVKAMVNAGACSIKMKNLDAAERYLLDALRYDPDLPATQANLARVYYERRDYNRAGFFLHRLTAQVKPDSLSAEVLWLAARIERKLGDTALETAMLTQLRRHHPTSPEFAAFQRGAFDE
ncbi:MAG: type IV pilus biogenesis/stability protein PilW [Gammaproteobacteria bacterium]